MNKSAKYIALICYAIMAILNIINLIDYFSIDLLLEAIGAILILIALLTSVPFLSVVGFSIWLIQLLIICVQQFNGNLPLLDLFVLGIGIVICLLLIFAGICIKYAKILGIIAAFAEAIRRGIVIFLNVSGGWGIRISIIVWAIVTIVGALFIGIAYDDIYRKKSVKTNTIEYLDSSKTNTLDENSTDKILKLKDLLDKGIITKEEFEEKKKQVLNL